MSEKTSQIPESPKTSKFVQKLNQLKPSTLSDEKKAVIVRRIQIGAAFATGVFATIAAVNAKSFYNSFPKDDETAETEETEETTED